MKSLNKLVYLCLLFLLFSAISINAAAEDADVYAQYTIEEGDFLSVIAGMFGTTVDDILAVNNIADTTAISIGTKINIPTLKGIEGDISTKYLNIGDTLSGLSILCGMPAETLAGINDLVSPTELFIGSLLTTIYNPNAENIAAVESFDEGMTLLEKSTLANRNPVELQHTNKSAGSWDFSDKQVLFSSVKTDKGSSIPHVISPLVNEVSFMQLPLTQGGTHVIHVNSPYDLTLTGSVGEQSLRFFKDENSQDQYAMLGIDAMAETGLSSFTLTGTTPDGESFSISQPILIEAGIFTYEVVEGVDASTLDPANQAVDTNALKSLTQTSETRSWGKFLSYPVDEPCFASAFGSRRSYNDGTFYNFHTGIDYSICLADNTNIYAAADGTVIFAQELPIHGNFTVIDHGWGVYTTYSHQAQQTVSAGQQVKRGDLIGLIGSTGRSVGPHLHFEVIINGVYVNPLSWLSTSYP